VLTAHERLRSQTRYPLSTLSCPRTQKPTCVLAPQTNLAKLLCNRRSGLTLPPKPVSAPHGFVPTRRSNAHTSHQAPVEIP